MSNNNSNSPKAQDPVNISTVLDLSPFRYPGGKTWLVPIIRQWFASFPTKPKLFVEPFAGGAIISLTVAYEDLADRVIMVEIDKEVAAVWKTIINYKEGGIWLANQITKFNFSEENVELELNRTSRSVKHLAFQTILKNRVNRGGILANGAGRIRRGENDKGLGSRWYPQTLKKRILRIVDIRRKITFKNSDGLLELRRYSQRRNVIFFIDPPYTVAGKKAGRRLYNHSELDHEELFRIAKGLSGDFLMTYENCTEVQNLALSHGFEIYPIIMKNTHNKKKEELLIGRDLSWFNDRMIQEN